MIIELSDQYSEPRKLRRALDALEAGEVIAYATDTVYALGCDAFNKKAVDKLYAIKRMPTSHPVALICADIAAVSRYAIVENAQFRLLKHHLPGAYCFILNATRDVPRLLHTSKRKTIGVRVPNHIVPTELARELGRPLATTTAQRHDDHSAFVDARDIEDELPGVSIVLDSGAGSLELTSVVDLTGPHPEIVRRGLGPVDDFE